VIAEGAELKQKGLPQKAYLSEGYDWLSRMLARAPPALLMLQHVTFNNSLISPRSNTLRSTTP
jgi:hypothetical protein